MKKKFFYVLYGTKHTRSIGLEPIHAPLEAYTNYMDDSIYNADHALRYAHRSYNPASGIMWEGGLSSDAMRTIDGHTLEMLGWSYRPSTDGRDPVVAIYSTMMP